MGFLLLIFALFADMFKRIKRNEEEILYRIKDYKHHAYQK
jgi:hypothetical protein